MKASEWTYQRPDLTRMSQTFHAALDRFVSADSADTQLDALRRMNEVRDGYEDMKWITYIRHTQDTSDEVYVQEQGFFDETLPTVDGWTAKLNAAMLASRFRTELEQHLGSQWFSLAELKLKTYAPEVEDDLRRENELSSKHAVWIAQAKIPFDGEEKSINDMHAYRESPDRTVRKASTDAVLNWMSGHADEFERLYHDLVALRTSIARKLGFDDFVGLGYARMSRVDYTREDVKRFRSEVKAHIVPLLTELAERQRKRLGVDSLTYYDRTVQFATGNAKPKGRVDWLVDRAGEMYHELSPETDEFFQFLRDNELLDLTRRANKAMMGYCEYIPGHKSPFIFSLETGTSFDVVVLTHEAGHAFQMYMNQHSEVPEYRWPTSDGAEIDSKVMELLTWPWMDRFFAEDAEKFKYDHLVANLLEIAFTAMFDEFQEASYSHPDWTRDERRKAFREIQRLYQPYVDTEGHPHLEGGYDFLSFFHIYAIPFYTIDYALAQVCAFQFWSEAQVNREAAWEKYVALCKLGGTLPFQSLVKASGLRSPFQQGCVADVTAVVNAYLDGVDDSGW